MAIRYKGSLLDMGFRLDMVVDDMVLIENKSVQSTLPVHQAQLLTYLKLSGYRLGFLVKLERPSDQGRHHPDGASALSVLAQLRVFASSR